MKLFVVSDIHGHANILKDALKQAGYDPSNDQHLLICCGDCFDRGHENRDVLHYFEQIEYKVLVKGNHDARLMEILHTGRLGFHDFLNGTIETITEFFGPYSVMELSDQIDFSGKTSIVNRLSAFIDGMVNYYETKHYIFVHGWLPNQKGRVLQKWRTASEGGWDEARWTWWTNGINLSGNPARKTIICGHYPTSDSNIYFGNGMIAIDAGTYSSQRINVLVIDDELL